MTAAATLKHALPDPLSLGERVPIFAQPAFVSFPPFRLDLVEDRLWKGPREVPLRPKPFAILRYLAQRPRRLVTHSELVDAVWGHPVALSASVLRSHMHDLRHIIGGGVIETVVGRGYRFLGAAASSESGGCVGQRPSAGSIAAYAANAARDTPFEPPQAGAPGSVAPITTRPIPNDSQARVLKQLLDALAAMGLNAGVVFVVGDAQSLSFDLTTSSATEDPKATP
jgi:DNA-binding winged helix-turn-helix (wHTH) protein